MEYNKDKAWIHYSALSNIAGIENKLVCPKDSRRAASDISILSNTNVSFFINTKACINKPDIVLSGDRNLTNELVNGKHKWQWNRQIGIHGNTGFLLFSDGHVEMNVDNESLNDLLKKESANAIENMLFP